MLEDSGNMVDSSVISSLHSLVRKAPIFSCVTFANVGKRLHEVFVVKTCQTKSLPKPSKKPASTSWTSLASFCPET